MDQKRNNTRIMMISLVLCVVGLAFVLASVFDAGASKPALIIGTMCGIAGNLLNVIRYWKTKKNPEE